MANLDTTHTVTRNGRRHLERPANRRPAHRLSESRPSPRHITEVLFDLAHTRQSYEDLRVGSGSLDERARLLSVLHELRAEASQVRSTTEGM